MAHRPKVDNSVDGVRSKQNLSCNWTGSADFGRLVPIHWEELLQGDHIITCKPRIEMQMLPFASPTFGKIDLYCHYFVVPLRQIQKDFYEFWSRTGVNKDLPLLYMTPSGLANEYANSLQSDVFRRAAFKHWTSLGLNPFFTLGDAVTDDTTPIWLAPFLAYNKIWWDFYRDPELIRDESKSMYVFDGHLSDIDQNFINRYMLPHVRSVKNCWIADLFAQPGGTPGNNGYVYPFNEDQSFASFSETLGTLTPPYVDGTDVVDDSQMKLRLLESLTRLSERLSLSGKREIEALFARYGVKPKWSEMNLCRYVGGAKSTVLVDNIISNADTAENGGSPLGAKAGAGYCALNDLNIEVSVDEPSILMGIVSVMPHVHFVQGLSKKWQRKNLADMFQDSLQYVGNVAVARREVAFKYRENQSYSSVADGHAFAFSDPYYEYKMGLDILAGDFMTYHGVELPQDEQAKKDVLYMQSMETYIDYPYDRDFKYDNLLVDGDQYNKVFSYLGGSIWEDVDDHFHLSIDKEVVIERPMEGFAIPTLETTSAPHKKTQVLSNDKML